MKAGTIIICQNKNCSSKIGKITRDVFAGELICATMIEGIEQPILTGDKMNCKKCGNLYFANGMFHTENGWEM